MDSNTQEKLTSVVTDFGQELLQYLKDGTELAKGQAPLICKEIINWGLAESLACAVLGLLLIAFGIFMGKSDSYKEPSTLKDEEILLYLFLVITPFVVGSMMLCINIYIIFYISILPQDFILLIK